MKTFKQFISEDVTPIFETEEHLIRQGYEYEGRLFGGAYSHGEYNKAHKTSPKKKMIKAGRNQYNTIRQKLGMSPISDWTTRPKDLIQHKLK